MVWLVGQSYTIFNFSLVKEIAHEKIMAMLLKSFSSYNFSECGTTGLLGTSQPPLEDVQDLQIRKDMQVRLFRCDSANTARNIHDSASVQIIGLDHSPVASDEDLFLNYESSVNKGEETARPNKELPSEQSPKNVFNRTTVNKNELLELFNEDLQVPDEAITTTMSNVYFCATPSKTVESNLSDGLEPAVDPIFHSKSPSKGFNNAANIFVNKFPEMKETLSPFATALTTHDEADSNEIENVLHEEDRDSTSLEEVSLDYVNHSASFSKSSRLDDCTWKGITNRCPQDLAPVAHIVQETAQEIPKRMHLSPVLVPYEDSFPDWEAIQNEGEMKETRAEPEVSLDYDNNSASISKSPRLDDCTWRGITNTCPQDLAPVAHIVQETAQEIPKRMHLSPVLVPYEDSFPDWEAILNEGEMKETRAEPPDTIELSFKLSPQNVFNRTTVPEIDHLELFDEDLPVTATARSNEKEEKVENSCSSDGKFISFLK